jgi:hypothetical protein
MAGRTFLSAFNEVSNALDQSRLIVVVVDPGTVENADLECLIGKTDASTRSDTGGAGMT